MNRLERAASQSSLINCYRDASYDPYWGWSTLRQPGKELEFSAEDYCDIADASTATLAQQMRGFCDWHGYSYVEIPANEFRYQFEESAQDFRPWFEQSCRAKGVSSNVDVAIIGPSLKSHVSARRKTAERIGPSDIVDYLRGMYIVLKGQGPHKDLISQRRLPLLKRIIDDVENFEGSLARKNLFWQPHQKTRFRAHKSEWLTYASQDSDWDGFQILSEIKIQHEDQMEVDKLTRRFMNFGRLTDAFVCTSCNGTYDHQAAKRAAAATRHTDLQAKAISEWGGLLFDRLYEDKGINAFLNPSLSKDYAPLSHEQIAVRITKDLKEFPKGAQSKYRHLIAKAGVLNPQSLGLTRQEIAELTC